MARPGAGGGAAIRLAMEARFPCQGEPDRLNPCKSGGRKAGKNVRSLLSTFANHRSGQGIRNVL